MSDRFSSKKLAPPSDPPLQPEATQGVSTVGPDASVVQPAKSSTKRARQSRPKVFKRYASDMVRMRHSIAKVAQHFNISMKTLVSWMKDTGRAGLPGSSISQDHEIEYLRLMAELSEARLHISALREVVQTLQSVLESHYGSTEPDAKFDQCFDLMCDVYKARLADCNHEIAEVFEAGLIYCQRDQGGTPEELKAFISKAESSQVLMNQRKSILLASAEEVVAWSDDSIKLKPSLRLRVRWETFQAAQWDAWEPLVRSHEQWLEAEMALLKFEYECRWGDQPSTDDKQGYESPEDLRLLALADAAAEQARRCEAEFKRRQSTSSDVVSKSTATTSNLYTQSRT